MVGGVKREVGLVGGSEGGKAHSPMEQLTLGSRIPGRARGTKNNVYGEVEVDKIPERPCLCP